MRWTMWPVPAVLAGLLVLCLGAAVEGDVFNMPAGETSLSFVTVGDAGNAADTTGFGAVGYAYQMGKFDVTSGQYTAFLDAVASADPYGLYNGSMNPGSTIGSPGIVRSGNSGSYAYSVLSAYLNFPVTEVTWGDAARFANWLSNGQPATGVENSTTTENGSYALNGAVSDNQLNAVTRKPSATYVIPSENEWYKAAFYKGGSTNAYWVYPTQSDSPPSNVLSMTGQNNANFFDTALGYSAPPYYLTPVGFFASSPSAFGTYDQGGNVANWLDPVSLQKGREVRGGAWDTFSSSLQSDSSEFFGPATGTGPDMGFRIAEVPEPSSVAILALGSVGLLRRRT